MQRGQELAHACLKQKICQFAVCYGSCSFPIRFTILLHVPSEGISTDHFNQQSFQPAVMRGTCIVDCSCSGPNGVFYVLAHSLEGMVDVKSRRCCIAGCQKYPAFNAPGESIARFCGEHRQAGMIDVHNKRCREPDCQKRPTFNHAGAPQASLYIHVA